MILADEPTGELDRDNTEQIVQLLAERAKRGAAVVVVTHNPVVAGSADRIVHLVDGTVSS